MKNNLKETWEKIINTLNNFFRSNKEPIKMIEEKTPEKIESILADDSSLPKNEIIENAKKAFEKYALDDDPDKTVKICNTLKERLDENEGSIRRVLELTNDETDYEDIVQILTNNIKKISEYKKNLYGKKVDEHFIYHEYQVPFGVVAVEVNNTKDAIENLFAAVVTRNAIILMESNDNPYRIEKLIEIIIGECLEKFDLDRNLIQILENEKVSKDLVDLYIDENKQVIKKQPGEIYYLYKEDDFFDKYIIEEKDKLIKLGKKVQIIEGEPSKVIEVINNNKAFASAIYTQNRKLGYRFINLINADNVYMNATLENAKTNENLKNIYYRKKNIAFQAN